MRKISFTALVFVGVATMSACTSDPISPATALDGPVNTITINLDAGTGFVGKGDVQYTFGLNNPQIQALASTVQFRISATTVTEASWECTKITPNGNEVVQERSSTTTTSLTGLFTTIARERNQITGFILSGYAVTPTNSSVTRGPALNTCANANSGFVLSTSAEPTVVSTSGGLEVSATGYSWTALLEKPI